ncbi:hypothetical protein BZA77DRAFT_319958 [Pyronema omphalodes]|nr:hypothetical protein BZA77DRAFT_319958 [Pyronema omphalodes]
MAKMEGKLGTVGPYMLQNLVDDLPLDTPERQDVTITCLESWGQNLYVGTSAHEILHLVSIPPTPHPDAPSKPCYILASRLQPLAASTPADPFIKQILVLPTVSKALVLSSTGWLTFYSLPEFSPAYNGTKLKDVSYIGGLDLNEEEREGIPEEGSREGRPKLVMCHAKNKIRLVRCLSEEIRLVKDLPLSATLTSIRRDSIACVANNENYSLLDIENIQRIPLFPISAVSEDPPSPTTPAPPPPEHDIPPQRTTPLSPDPQRERRNSAVEESTRLAPAPDSQSRSVSAGPLSRPSTANRMSGSHLTPGGEGSSSAGPAATPQQAAPSSRKSQPPPPPPKPLMPNIASPSPGEFLLTTGTRPEDPGVGMFVNLEGDVTRGTIQFEKYPDQLLVQGSWVIAVIPGKGLDMQRWDMENEEVLDESDRSGSIPLEGRVKMKEVLSLEGTEVADAGRTLKLVRVALKESKDKEEAQREEDKFRNEEERIVAKRISTVESRVVVFAGRKVWTLLPCPLTVQLDSRLPSFSEENFDGIVARVHRVLHVLQEVQSIEPSTETQFHEVSFVRQKCGLLVLGELLRITQKQTADITAHEILKTEVALMESALDPRFIVALFGPAFQDDIVESEKGVWVYGGIKEVFMNLRNSADVGKRFTRDVLLLLKRYLASWRQKKGFGSVSDEKDVFRTVDAALLRVLLMLDSPEYLEDKGNTVVPEGNIRTEIHALLDAGLDNLDHATKLLESFNRLYFLSIVYARAKQYRKVLETWRRIVETGDPTGEFKQGEERVKNYLLRLKEPDLVEEFGCWLASRNSALGIQVFASPDSRVKLEPSRVLELLKEKAPDAVRAYVEYLVVEQKNETYASDLLTLYLTDLLSSLSSDPNASDSLQTTYTSYRALSNPKPTYHEFITDNSSPLSPPWWHSRLKFLSLLASSSSYDVPAITAKLSPHASVLVPEMVILHGRASSHKEALHLLVHTLADYDTAINYCLFGGMSLFTVSSPTITPRSEQQELFRLLLDEFLELEDVGQRIEETAGLLEKFGQWLEVEYVLKKVPDEWSVAILKGFLMSALRGLVRERAEVRIQRRLGGAMNLDVEARWVKLVDERGPTVEGA